MLKAVVQTMNDTLPGKEEPKKGNVPDYPLPLRPRVFLFAVSTSAPSCGGDIAVYQARLLLFILSLCLFLTLWPFQLYFIP